MDTRVTKQDSSTCCFTFTVFVTIKCNNKDSVTMLLTNTVSDYRKYIAESVHEQFFLRHDQTHIMGHKRNLLSPKTIYSVVLRQKVTKKDQTVQNNPDVTIANLTIYIYIYIYTQHIKTELKHIKLDTKPI